ncbi:MAG: transposase [Methanotrichaceae archaeon]
MHGNSHPSGITFEGLQCFRNWIKDNGCQKVAVGSTANYRHLIYSILEEDVGFILANAYQIKHIPGRKTDILDSEWIAELCLENMITPSRVLPKKDRDLS